jgi:serine/threonine protein phosphatase PrpC
MSTQSFIPRICKDAGRFTLAILVGVLLAMQCFLPATVFARVRGQTAAFSSHSLQAQDSVQSQVLDQTGVSVVRLVISYGNGTQKALTCTDLGVLVGSMSFPQTGVVAAHYQNWVLTDGDLVGSSAMGCGKIGGTNTLSGIQILASNEYTTNVAADAQLGKLTCTTLPNDGQSVCQDQSAEIFTIVSSKNNSYSTLFTFQTAGPQPYLSANTATSLTTSYNVGLTSTDGKPFPQATLTTSATDPVQSYLQQNIVSSGASQPGTSSTGGIEAGTAVVDPLGQLSGIYLMNGTELPLAQSNLQTYLQPFATVINPLKTNWDRGITVYYQGLNEQGTTANGSFQQAETDFQQALYTNTSFKAAQYFESQASARLHPTSPTPTPTPRKQTAPVSASSGINSADLLLVALGAGVLVLIALLIIVTMILGRARKRRRELARFEAEQETARRMAEAAMQNRSAQPPSLFQPGDVPCPNCHQPVRLVDSYCPHCRFPLSPSASGLSVRLSGSGPIAVPPAQTLANGGPPPMPISEQPTVQFLPNAAVVNHEQVTGETTMKRTTKNIQSDETILDVNLMNGRNLGLTVGTRSDPGIKRKHKPNEDSMFAMQGGRTHNSQTQHFGLFVVADGMGGHANGQDASRLAIQTIIDFMLPRISVPEPLSDEGFMQLLGDGVQNANQAVHNRNLESHADMGTTMTGTLVVGSTAYVANVGDSRTYLYRQGQGLSKVTHDHSVVASLVDAGIIQEDDVYTHPKRNQIYRSLGEKPVVEVDTFKVDLQAGDKLLLCSDGLWDMVRDPLIQQVLSKQTADPDKTGQDLIKAALQGGGEDNVTVIVVQFDEINQHTGMTGIRLLAKPDSVDVPPIPPIQ